MATAPILTQLPLADTLGALAQRVVRKVNEPIGPGKLQLVYDDVGDGIESLWTSAMLASLSKFTKGPVTQVVTSQTTNIISVVDPVVGPSLSTVAGGSLPSRLAVCSYCLVTESGSTTLRSPLASLIVPINQLVRMQIPFGALATVPPGVVGWYAFAGTDLTSGSDQGQQSPLLDFGQSWYEPPAGLTRYPDAPAPPTANTTGDNIFSIDRIDVQNVDQTWTNWLQSSLNSSFFTQFQHQIATATTWNPFVYDFIDDRQLEVRPAPAMPMSAVYFYVHKPRRPRFPQARLPFTSFVSQPFLFAWAMERYLLGIYEFEASDRWAKKAEEERQRIILQISQGNWNQNATVRPFMR